MDHAILNKGRPWLYLLLFSKDSDKSSKYDISGMDFIHTCKSFFILWQMNTMRSNLVPCGIQCCCQMLMVMNQIRQRKIHQVQGIALRNGDKLFIDEKKIKKFVQ